LVTYVQAMDRMYLYLYAFALINTVLTSQYWIYIAGQHDDEEFGRVVVIYRDGRDGPAFPLTASQCIFGRCSTLIIFL